MKMTRRQKNVQRHQDRLADQTRAYLRVVVAWSMGCVVWRRCGFSNSAIIQRGRIGYQHHRQQQNNKNLIVILQQEEIQYQYYDIATVLTQICVEKAVVVSILWYCRSTHTTLC